MRVALVSLYDLGRQPFGLASPAAWLGESGFQVSCCDLSCEPLNTEAIRRADLVAVFLPMHTATRLVEPIARRVRQLNPSAHLCAYGLYAPPNAHWLRSLGFATFLGGEFEEELLQLAQHLAGGSNGTSGSAKATTAALPGRPVLPRLEFRVPDRRALPKLSAYAHLALSNGESRTVGYSEASRGCLHTCRHCPIVPVYGGQFRIVPAAVVLADIRQQVEAGAAHITFGDPDFFNGTGHAMRVVEALARECPGLTYDVTIKVEHLLRHAVLLPGLRETGCLFVTTAVESLDDDVLRWLDKGHTRADFERVVALCRDAGVGLAPTFIPFTPWTTIRGYRELLDVIDDLDLVGCVPSIQLAIRLLIPSGSVLLELPEIAQRVAAFDRETLTHPWAHADPSVEALSRDAMELVRGMARSPRAAVFDALRALSGRYAGMPLSPRRRRQAPFPRTDVPYLSEPWYC